MTHQPHAAQSASRRSARLIVALHAAILTAALMTGCAGAGARTYVASAIPADKPAVGRPTLGMPVMITASDWAIVPFTLERPLQPFESKTSYGASASFAESKLRFYHFQPHGVVWHNAIFENQSTGQAHLLLDRKALITQFTEITEPVAENEKPGPPVLLIFAIAEADTNADGHITADDAVRAYACNVDGSDLRPISPPNTQLWSLSYDFDQQVLYLMAMPDTNNDKRFTSDDTAQLIRFTPTSRSGVPVVSDDLRRKAEALLR